MINPIYKPKGAAAEYGEWALNIYTGCPHRCFYCYVPQVLRIDRVTFHSCVAPREGIIEAVDKQLYNWRKSGVKDRLIFLCFACDPYPRGFDCAATREIITLIKRSGNNVKVLTENPSHNVHSKNVAYDLDLLDDRDWFGLTDDCILPAKNPDYDGSRTWRREILKKAKSKGVNTWISFEPILNVETAISNIEFYRDEADLMAFGALNHVKLHKPIDYAGAAERISAECEKHGVKYLIKSSLKGVRRANER
jgi:DNA repair photolyase